MGTSVLIGCAAAALLGLAVLSVLLVRARAESQRAHACAAAETAELRRRLDSLTAQLERTRAETVRLDDPAYLITDAGDREPRAPVPDRVVLSATVGEPLVKAVAVGHGLRRALSARSRNRIWFEMRREVRRARKQRRREMKAAWRHQQAVERAAGDPGTVPTSDAA